MSDIGIGKLIRGNKVGRDAIHVAVIPMVAGEILTPGQHVGLAKDGRVIKSNDQVGVVDPYLKVSVRSGQRFWLFLYPGSITSLRHEWTHPKFKDAVPLLAKTVSMEWMSEFAI